MQTILEHIDTFSSRCGFFNHKTVANNGYGCNHPGCDDGTHVKVLKSPDSYGAIDRYITGIFSTLLIKKMTKRKIRCNRRLAKKFIKKAQSIEFNNEQLAKYRFKWQGCCHTFTCPLAFEADEQDIKDHGEDPEDYSPGEWMVVDNSL